MLCDEDCCAFRMTGDKTGHVWSWRGYCLVVIQLHCGSGSRREKVKAGSRDIHNKEIGISDN